MDADGITLRDGAYEDPHDVVDLWQLAYGAGSLRSLREDIPTLLSHRHGARLLLAERDGLLVGTLIVTFDGWRGNMYRLAVHPDFRRPWHCQTSCRAGARLVEGAAMPADYGAC